jgi:hypothetical protein
MSADRRKGTGTSTFELGATICASLTRLILLKVNQQLVLMFLYLE